MSSSSAFWSAKPICRRPDRIRVGGVTPPSRPEARRSEYPVSRGGLHQESRDHNKHNRAGQTGHKPQQHGPAEEKT